MTIKTQIYVNPDIYGISYSVLLLFGGDEICNIDGKYYFRIDKKHLSISYRCNKKNEQYIVSMGDIMNFWKEIGNEVDTERWKILCKKVSYEGINIKLHLKIIDKEKNENIIDKVYNCHISNPEQLIDNIRKDVYEIIKKSE